MRNIKTDHTDLKRPVFYFNKKMLTEVSESKVTVDIWYLWASLAGLRVATIKDLDAIARTWYNLPIEGAKAIDLIGSVQIIDFSIFE